MKYQNYLLNDFISDDYFLGWIKNPDEESNNFWLNWVTQNPEKKDMIEEARQIILLINNNVTKPSPEDFQEVKNNIFKLIHEEESQDGKSSSEELPLLKALENQRFKTGSASDFNLKKYYFRAAAIFIGLLILSASFILYIQLNQFTRYTTEFGETKSIKLPDGSAVVLNSNSTLKVSKDWDVKNYREVWLEGEAFFQVLKKNRPELAATDSPKKNVKFIVHVNKLNVEVIGTRFNVNSRRGMVKIVLNSGQVNLHSNKNNLIMKPGEMVEFSPSQETFSKKSVEVEKLTSWRNQKFIFEETPLGEIAQVIEDNYGFEVKFDDQALAGRNFTGSLPYQDIDLFLTVLAESFNLKIIKKQDTIMMRTK